MKIWLNTSNFEKQAIRTCGHHLFTFKYMVEQVDNVSFEFMKH